MWFLVFVAGFPFLLYRALRHPAWAAAGAGYFYFAIPPWEFRAPNFPYQTAFWLIAIAASARYRLNARKDVRAELIGLGVETARDVVDGVREELWDALANAALDKLPAGQVRFTAIRAVAEKTLGRIDEIAPLVIAEPVRTAVQKAIEMACEDAEREALDVMASRGEERRGTVRAALEQRARPVFDLALNELLGESVAAHLDRLIEKDESTQAARRRKKHLGALDFPRAKTPFFAVVQNPALLLHLVFIFLTWTGARTAQDEALAFGVFDRVTLLLIPMVAIVCAIRNDKHWFLFVWTWMFGVGHICINGINIWRRWGGRADLAGGQGNEANFLGAIAVSVTPIALSMMLEERDRARRWIGAIAAGIYLLGLIASGSRGALMALAVALAYWVACTNRKLIALSVALSGVAVYLAVAPEAFWQRLEASLFKQEANPWLLQKVEPSANERLELWDLAIELYMEHPLAGIGPQQYTRESAVLPITDAYRGTRGMMTHNSWLQIAAEYGTIGLVVWGGNFALSFLCLRRARRKLERYPETRPFGAYCLGFEAGLIASAVAITFSSYHFLDYMYWSMVIGPLTLEIAGDVVRKREWAVPAGRAEQRPPPRWGPPAPQGETPAPIGLAGLWSNEDPTDPVRLPPRGK